MAEQYPYPSQEHYEFPKTQTEQAREELRIYPEWSDFRANLLALMRMYEKTPCMKSMERYAILAEPLRTDSETNKKLLNHDFYNGALLGVHVNLAPAPTHIKRKVLSTEFLADLDENPLEYEIAQSVTAHIEEWSGSKKNNWRAFLDEQDRGYRDAATELALKLYENVPDSEEQQLDFMVGFTFASNLVWQTAQDNYKVA